MNKTLHICSLNCQKEKRNRLYTWLKYQRTDILFIQETHFVVEIENKVNNEYAADIFHSYDTTQSKGVAIFIKKPNEKKKRNVFFKNVNKIIEDHSLGILVVGGDMNETLSRADRKNNKKIENKKLQILSLKTLIKTNKLEDIWRQLLPKLYQYTRKRKNKDDEASRIDYFLTGKELRTMIKSTDIRPALISNTDHQAI